MGAILTEILDKKRQWEQFLLKFWSISDNWRVYDVAYNPKCTKFIRWYFPTQLDELFRMSKRIRYTGTVGFEHEIYFVIDQWH